MRHHCPHCSKRSEYIFDDRTIRRHGSFYRTSDSKSVERFQCLLCKKTFSKATFDEEFLQKKRQKNNFIFELCASGVSGRRTARLLRINRKTVARRLVFFGKVCRHLLFIETASKPVHVMQFDDLETFEHSKCKPLSVSLALEEHSRRILGFRVAQMAAKGLLAKRSIKKYGFRRDERTLARRDLFKELAPIVVENGMIKSDSNPYYAKDIREFFPTATHVKFLGKRGAITG